jgi:hypothetical protein
VRPRTIGVILLEADHSVETLDLPDPFAWEPPAGLTSGFWGNPAAWPLPVVFAVARGATGAASAQRTPEAVQGVVDAIARLDGRCDLIVGGCGYFGAAWPALPAPPRTPTVLSGLDLLDDALRSTSADVAVLSMSADAAAGFLASRPDANRIRVVGMDGARDWDGFAHPDWAIAPQWTLDGLESGLRDVLGTGALDGIGAVVIECTVLPQFRSVIREHTPAPIFELGAVVAQLVL